MDAKVEPCGFIDTSLYDALNCLDNFKFQIREENSNLAENHAALIKKIKEEEANLLLYTLVPIITTTPMFAAETAVILNTPTNVIIPALEAVILAPPPIP